MRKFLLSFILLAVTAMGKLYCQDLTILYKITQTSATESTVTLKLRNNTVSLMKIGAVNFSMVYNTTGGSGNTAVYNSTINDEFLLIWPPSILYDILITEPLGVNISRGGDSYNARWQYGNTDLSGGITYDIPANTTQTVMEVVLPLRELLISMWKMNPRMVLIKLLPNPLV